MMSLVQKHGKVYAMPHQFFNDDITNRNSFNRNFKFSQTNDYSHVNSMLKASHSLLAINITVIDFVSIVRLKDVLPLW